MKVRLEKRIGQNDVGTTLDLSDTEAQWLVDQGIASAADSGAAQSAPAGPSAPGGSGEPDAPRRGGEADVPRRGPGRPRAGGR